MTSTKRTKTERYYDWLKIQRKESIRAQEQKEKFMEELGQIRTM